ncbi:hypothetical protein A33Q_3359 [Indibacter alkaliphilus LW1]|uniref:Uncharacterized protein n=1 Tax=Indibacter alkaliphilus (strain CCUG 57479 / KCTC 22604 / LW1) TaxID=1189612 RepID=S2D8C1_INDAL|nr:hypothetical protein A33Q_3359 [Indibacter alkaliphilus LW1]
MKLKLKKIVWVTVKFRHLNVKKPPRMEWLFESELIFFIA